MVLINEGNLFITKTSKEEIKKIDFATCNEPSQTLDEYYDSLEEKPRIMINGGLFNMNLGKPVMDYIDEGETKSYEAWIKLGIGIVGDSDILYGSVDERNWRDFISGYPVLIANGEKQEIKIANEISYRTRRTVLGYNNSFVFTIGSDYPGQTFDEIKEIAFELGCEYAINLDGGTSTGLICNGSRYLRAYYNRPLDNVVCIYTGKKVIYRVQIGAFRYKENAEIYKNIIKGLNDTIGAGYKNAYVRMVDGLYKVQVGAFSYKENAENVLKDLRKKGFNPFITTK